VIFVNSQKDADRFGFNTCLI